MLQYTFFAFFGLFELGSLLCGVANSSDMLIIGRAIAGMGGSGLSSGAISIIAASAPLAKRPGESLTSSAEPRNPRVVLTVLVSHIGDNDVRSARAYKR